MSGITRGEKCKQINYILYFAWLQLIHKVSYTLNQHDLADTTLSLTPDPVDCWVFADPVDGWVFADLVDCCVLPESCDFADEVGFNLLLLAAPRASLTSSSRLKTGCSYCLKPMFTRFPFSKKKIG